MTDSVIFDVDGTLVDSSYQHLQAWSLAFAGIGVPVPAWRLHAHMGMGGDQLVGAVAGPVVEEQYGDDLREIWADLYDRLLDHVRAFPLAADLLSRTAATGRSVVLATSGSPRHTGRTLEILGLDESSYPMVTAGEVKTTKPAPDLVRAALAKVAARRGLMVGDTEWDVLAAARAGVPAVGLRTGGIAAQVLEAAGAVAVLDDPAQLIENLDDLLAGLDGSTLGAHASVLTGHRGRHD